MARAVVDLVLGCFALLPWATAWLPSQNVVLTPEIYIVGDSTAAGWSLANSIKMDKDPGTNVFRKTLQIKDKGYGFKWVRSQSGWSNDLGTYPGTWAPYGGMGYGAQGLVGVQPVESNVPPATVTATYDLVLDMDQGIWYYSCSADCGAIGNLIQKTAPFSMLSIIYSGKIRGNLLPTDDTTGAVCSRTAARQTGCSGGVPYIAAYARQLKASGTPTLLIDAGEFFYGGDFYTYDQGVSAGTLAAMMGYDAMNVNSYDMQGGVDNLKAFSATLGNLPLVLSNAQLPTALQGARASGTAQVSNYASVAVTNGPKVGLLGLASKEAEGYVSGLRINRVRGDVVATVMPNMEALRRAEQPDMVVVMNSLNVDSENQETLFDWNEGTLTSLVPGISSILGGVPSLAPLSFSAFGGAVVAYGWADTYGGKNVQRLDLMLNSVGQVVDYNFSTVPMGPSTVTLASNDAVLTKAYDLYDQMQAAAPAGSNQPVGTASVPFFYEGDTSRMPFCLESTPMLALLTTALKAACADCDAVFVHPSFVNGGLPQGPITRAVVSRALPIQGSDADLVVIDVAGPSFIEGLKQIFDGHANFQGSYGVRVSVNTFQSAPYPTVAMEVRDKSAGGAWVPPDRSRTYRVAFPRFNIVHKLPLDWSGLAVVRTLGSVQNLFISFIQAHTPLTASLAGGLGATADLGAFQLAYRGNCDSVDTAAGWAAGCAVITAGNHEDPSRLGLCPDGQYINADTYLCQKCPAGMRQVFVATGSPYYSIRFQLLTRSGVEGSQPQRCSPCEPGRISEEGTTSCVACPKATYSGVSGGTVCIDCPAHTVALDPGAAACQADMGFYTLNGTVTACPDGRTTSRYGAPSVDFCLCKEGSYDAGDGSCQPCPGGMICPFGSSAQAWANVRAGGAAGGPYPTLIPDYWSGADTPFETYQCQSALYCPGGDPGTCKATLVDRSCAHCQSDSYWDGETCQVCTEAQKNRFFYPVLPLFVAAIVLYGMYKTSGDGIEKWSSFGTSMASLMFVGLSHYQALNLLAEQNLKVTSGGSELRDTMKKWAFTNHGLEVFKPACTGIYGFQASVIGETITPLIIIAIGCLLFLGFNMAAKVSGKAHLGWERNRTFNVLASVMFTFFSAISAMSLVLFKCKSNPSGNDTLMKDLSVICWKSSEWQSMLGVGVAALIVYCGGMGVAFTAAIIRASTQFVDPGFRARWKCLFIKYRAETWWWSGVYLLKFLLYNLVFVVTQDTINQIYLYLTITQFYSLAIVYCMPYRVLVCNYMELSGALSLTYILAILSDFAGLTHESPLVMAGALISWVPLIFCGLCWFRKVRWHVDLQGGWKNAKFQAVRPALPTEWVEKLRLVCGDLAKAGPEDIARFTRLLVDYDAWIAQKFVVIVESEMFGEANKFRIRSQSKSNRSSSHSKEEAPKDGAQGAAKEAPAAAVAATTVCLQV